MPPDQIGEWDRYTAVLISSKSAQIAISPVPINPKRALWYNNSIHTPISIAGRFRLFGAHILIAGTILGSYGSVAVAQLTTEARAITRAEVTMLLILARTPNIPVVRNIGQFKDVQIGAWHEPYMMYAESIGIVNADSNGYLYPGSIVSRAEFLKMLTVTFKLTPDLPQGFSDVPKGSWYARYAGIAWNTGLLPLTNGKFLEPLRQVSRGEARSAIDYYETLSKYQQNVRLEQEIASEQAKQKLTLYTVISTRRQNVALVQHAAPASNLSYNPSAVLHKAAPSPVAPSASRIQLRKTMFELVNAERAHVGLGPLLYDERFEASAQKYADRMANEGFFGHTTPDGQTVRDRVASTGYYDRTFSLDCRCVKGYALGENLARGQKTPQEAVDAWLQSPAHRNAILNPVYTEFGVGISAGIWVQHFGGLLLPE